MLPVPCFRRRCLAALLAFASGALAAQGYPRTPADYLRQMDANGDGRIGMAEYVSYMSQGFRRMDVDGDGTLEAAELPGGHGRTVTLKAWQADLRRQFKRLDRNHDGFLDARELAAPPG